MFGLLVAACYGSTRDITVHAYNLSTQRIRTLPSPELGFDYQHYVRKQCAPPPPGISCAQRSQR